ncbi:MAG TPA: type II toxin-antitoxin system HicB family antitoxin [Stellaceae bacterium]|nr:type II toxin-antitoxin system HicB family antitoxin [Stellaceae bacterium]
MTGKRKFTASIWREGKWYVAQCLEVDVASQGRTEKVALKNLTEALSLHFAAPAATASPKVRRVQITLRAA